MAHEAAELIEIHWVPFDDACRRALAGDINDWILRSACCALARSWPQAFRVSMCRSFMALVSR